MDKHYLADIQKRGLPVVPSFFIETGVGVDLHGMLDESGWSEAVIKPCVSGAARHTYRVNHNNAERLRPLVQRLNAAESLIFQQFQPDVMRHGEDTLILFGGRYSHAVRKVPKSGDFRVQDDHGGKVYPYRPSEPQIELAERVNAAVGLAPAYCRVDMVRDERDSLVVMEVELIEPELWLRFHPRSATRFARAIARIVHDNSK